MSFRFEVTGEQWNWMEPILRSVRWPDRKGRFPADTRRVLWILDTGAQWRKLPPEYGPFQTMHGRSQHLVREGKLEQVLRRLSEELYAQGKLKLAGAFIDATFAPASPHESRLVESTLAASFLETWGKPGDGKPGDGLNYAVFTETRLFASPRPMHSRWAPLHATVGQMAGNTHGKYIDSVAVCRPSFPRVPPRQAPSAWRKLHSSGACRRGRPQFSTCLMRRSPMLTTGTCSDARLHEL